MIQMTPCYIHTYAYAHMYVCMKANGNKKIKKVKKVLKKVLTNPLDMVL